MHELWLPPPPPPFVFFFFLFFFFIVGGGAGGGKKNLVIGWGNITYLLVDTNHFISCKTFVGNALTNQFKTDQLCCSTHKQAFSHKTKPLYFFARNQLEKRCKQFGFFI